MHVRFAKQEPGAPADTLTCVRPDASTTWHALPRRGILPHDAFHFVVETTLGWHDGLFGPVARGGTLAEVTTRLHGQAAGWMKLTQGFQIEALIECLEQEQWAGAFDPVAFAENLIAGCRRRAVVPPDLMPEELDRVRVALREFGAAWRPLVPGATLERTFRT